MPTLTELQNGENPEFLEKLNKRVWGLLIKLKAEQENVDIKFRIGNEQYDTADPKSMARCLGYAGKEDSAT